MTRADVTAIGMLRFTEDAGAQFSVDVGKKGSGERRTLWLDIEDEILNSRDWPGLGKYPEEPKEKPVPSYSRHIDREAAEARAAIQAANATAKKSGKRLVLRIVKLFGQTLNTEKPKGNLLSYRIVSRS
jgi:hypothetical protein